MKTKKNKTYYENQLKQLTIIREILKSYDTNDIQEIGAAYYDKYNSIRYDKCIAKTRGKEGIVALESQYRRYKGQEDFNIWNYQPDENRVRVLQKEAQQAIAEGFPATALKIGKDLWVYHKYNLYIHQILAAAYIALERPILLSILRKYIAKKNILDLLEFQDALKAPMDQITLKLYGKRLYELSKEIGVFKNLEKLDLEANELTSLPLQMGELTQLKELNLNSNKFISLPNVIGRLEQLKEFRLQRNNLKKLPDTFGQLQNLEKLYFLDAKFERFPKAICSLKKLKTLCIRFTEFEVLPEAIGDLLNLEKLILQGFDRFPETIKQLKKLEELTLINHRMPVLPAFIFQLKGLKALSITNGNMTKLPSAIGTLSAIELLSLSRNQLEILPPEIIQLKHLKWLRLSKNRCSEKELEQYEKWLPNVKITY